MKAFFLYILFLGCVPFVEAMINDRCYNQWIANRDEAYQKYMDEHHRITLTFDKLLKGEETMADSRALAVEFDRMTNENLQRYKAEFSRIDQTFEYCRKGGTGKQAYLPPSTTYSIGSVTGRTQGGTQIVRSLGSVRSANSQRVGIPQNRVNRNRIMAYQDQQRVAFYEKQEIIRREQEKKYEEDLRKAWNYLDLMDDIFQPLTQNYARSVKEGALIADEVLDQRTVSSIQTTEYHPSVKTLEDLDTSGWGDLIEEGRMMVRLLPKVAPYEKTEEYRLFRKESDLVMEKAKQKMLRNSTAISVYHIVEGAGPEEEYDMIWNDIYESISNKQRFATVIGLLNTINRGTLPVYDEEESKKRNGYIFRGESYEFVVSRNGANFAFYVETSNRESDMIHIESPVETSEGTVVFTNLHSPVVKNNIISLENTSKRKLASFKIGDTGSVRSFELSSQTGLSARLVTENFINPKAEFEFADISLGMSIYTSPTIQLKENNILTFNQTSISLQGHQKSGVELSFFKGEIVRSAPDIKVKIFSSSIDGAVKQIPPEIGLRMIRDFIDDANAVQEIYEFTPPLSSPERFLGSNWLLPNSKKTNMAPLWKLQKAPVYNFKWEFPYPYKADEKTKIERIGLIHQELMSFSVGN